MQQKEGSRYELIRKAALSPQAYNSLNHIKTTGETTMARDKNKTQENGNGAETEVEEVVDEKPEPKPVVDKDKLIKAFGVYDSQTKKLDDLQAQILKVTKERSETVKAILQANGKMPKLVRQGQPLTIVNRGDTFFIRGVKPNDGLTEL
jgi:hypothetical protein